jgi:Fic family protein
MDPIDPTSKTDPVNAWKEVFNYGKSLNFGRNQIDDGYPISLHLIRQLHQELLTGVRGSDQTPGAFRTSQVHIGSTRRFIPPPPLKVGQCLAELQNYLTSHPDLDPLIRCFLVHYQIETIHPFNDGNGRVGRLLLSLMVYKWCNLRGPWLYLSPFFERYKDEYIDCLFKVSSENNWLQWLDICLRATIEQSVDSVNRIDRLLEIKKKYHEKTAEIDSTGRLYPIIDSLFAEPLVRIPQLASRYDVSYPTAKGDVNKLIKVGILQELSGTYPKAFYAPEIMDIAYSASGEDKQVETGKFSKS